VFELLDAAFAVAGEDLDGETLGQERLADGPSCRGEAGANTIFTDLLSSIVPGSLQT
jgi:hypothetical protein